MSLFDVSLKKPSRALLMLEGRALLEMGAYYQALPLLRRSLPRGDGHPVLLLPGFLAGDGSTRLLRAFLKEKGYAAHRWELGLNLAFSLERMQEIERRVVMLKRQYGLKVSLVGWSMGGLFAREVARARPDEVRLVITLGTPFARNLKANNAHWLYRAINGHCADDIAPELIRRMQQPPPVPSTAIYSRTDGVVAWRCCMEPREGPLNESVRVRGSHCGLGFNPMALYVIGDRLAQPEGQWRRFERTGLRRLVYPLGERRAEGFA